MKLTRASLIALPLITLACSSKAPAPSSAPDAGPTLPPGVTTWTLTMQSHVVKGTEAHTCQFFKVPDVAKFLVGGSHTYTDGSHHMLLFRTDLTAIPAGQEGPQDCYEGSGGTLMSHVRGVVYGAQVPTGSQTYPAGVGLPVSGGAVVMMQTHYLDAGDKDLDARADLTLSLSDGTGVDTPAGVFFFYDPFIDVPIGATAARAQMRCLVRSDVTLLTASSHFHKRGTAYQAYLDPATGPLATTPFYTSADWDHPGTLAAPMPIAGGSRVRFSCTYANADTKEYFQGQSAADNEMCMFVGIYYPELGLADDVCKTDPDMLGAGSATCGDTLTCINNCQKSGIPPFDASKFAIGKADVDPCYQKCFVSSCGPAFGKLSKLSACTSAQCATECADTTSSACNACAQAKCPNEGIACLTDTCN